MILYRGEPDENEFEIKIYNPLHQRRNVRQTRVLEEEEEEEEKKNTEED
jgi:hypothetical protein